MVKIYSTNPQCAKKEYKYRKVSWTCEESGLEPFALDLGIPGVYVSAIISLSPVSIPLGIWQQVCEEDKNTSSSRGSQREPDFIGE